MFDPPNIPFGPTMRRMDFPEFELRIARDNGKVYVDTETNQNSMFGLRYGSMFGLHRGTMSREQIESQCANVEGIPRMLKDCVLRGDIYTDFASKRFGVPVENVTPAMRKAAKEILFQLYVWWIMKGCQDEKYVGQIVSHGRTGQRGMVATYALARGKFSSD